MTSDGLGEMFEGDSADKGCQQISAVVDLGLSGGSSVRRPGSEDPHQRQRKFISVYFFICPFIIFFLNLLLLIWVLFLFSYYISKFTKNPMRRAL